MPNICIFQQKKKTRSVFSVATATQKTFGIIPVVHIIPSYPTFSFYQKTPLRESDKNFFSLFPDSIVQSISKKRIQYVICIERQIQTWLQNHKTENTIFNVQKLVNLNTCFWTRIIRSCILFLYIKFYFPWDFLCNDLIYLQDVSNTDNIAYIRNEDE